MSMTRNSTTRRPGGSPGWSGTSRSCWRCGSAAASSSTSGWTGGCTGNEPVTELIDGKVRDASVFVLILSTGYLSSIWTARELETFRAEVGRRLSDESRVFVVEFGEAERPAELSRPRGYRFWQKDSLTDDIVQLGFPRLLPGHEAPYYKLVTELASDLERELRRLKAGPVAATTRRPRPVPPTHSTLPRPPPARPRRWPRRAPRRRRRCTWPT